MSLDSKQRSLKNQLKNKAMEDSKNIDELAKQSGEENVKTPPRYELPIIKLNGNEGVFILTPLEGDKVNIGNTITGTILKVRRKFGAFTTTHRFYTNEHDSPRNKITLFGRENKEKARSILIDEGTIDELKAKHSDPKLKMTQVLYFLTEPEHEIVKLNIGGKGLGSVFEFFRGLGKNEHVFQFRVEVGCVKEKSPAGKEYYATTIMREETWDDLTLVGEKIKEVSENLAKVENYYADVPEKKVEAAEEKMIDLDESDEVNVEDIPF